LKKWCDIKRTQQRVSRKNPKKCRIQYLYIDMASWNRGACIWACPTGPGHVGPSNYSPCIKKCRLANTSEHTLIWGKISKE